MSALRAPHRKPTRTLDSGQDMVDMGGLSTPPLFPPLSYHPESDMRSMPNDYMQPHRVTGQHRLRPQVDQDSAIYTSSDEELMDDPSTPERQPPAYPTWTPINDPSARPRKMPLDLGAFSLRNGYSISNAELRMNEIFEGEIENVDRKDGLVYHLGHKCQDVDGNGTSYSFVWIDDDPTSLPAQVKQWKDKETKKQRCAEGPALENNIRHMLETGSALIVERVGPRPILKDDETNAPWMTDHEDEQARNERRLKRAEEENVAALRAFHDEFGGDSDVKFPPRSASEYRCLLPDCRYSTDCFSPRHFYLTLRAGRASWQMRKPFCFCLSCFERLWMGHFSEHSEIRPAGIKVRQGSESEPQAAGHGTDTSPRSETPVAYSNELTLDGASDGVSPGHTPRFSSLCSSRHAPQEVTSSPLHHAIDENEDIASDSPRSMNSQGEWIAHVNRVQHIAAFFKPGKTLNEVETAAINLWKAASFEQLEWNKHLEKTKYRREYQAGDSLIDRSLNMDEYQIKDVDGQNIDEAAAEAIVKLPKSRFRGCSLADVWIAMRNDGATGAFV